MVQASKRDKEPSGSSEAGLQELLSPGLFKALSDPRRLALLMRMVDAGRPCTVGAVAEGSGVDLSVVSRHLAILREAGVIACRKQGKEVWCVVQTGQVVEFLRKLADALESCCPDGCRVSLAECGRGGGRRPGKERP